MTITLEQQDKDKAMSLVGVGPTLRCCPLYQCLKRHGLDVDLVGLSGFSTATGYYPLTEPAMSVTRLRAYDWPSIATPVTIDLPI